jgi:hypothetical protein
MAKWRKRLRERKGPRRAQMEKGGIICEGLITAPLFPVTV